MSQPKIAATEPVAVHVEAGKTYAWCACGASQNQPYCDGSHKTTGFRPVVFKAEESKEVWLCRCKRTQNQPYCDGSHEKL